VFNRLASFLAAWISWIAANTSSPLPFPTTSDSVSNYLDACTRALKLPPIHPQDCHAYCVRFRRSQGMDDPTVARELGQSNGGELIRNTYGEPLDPVGGDLHNWLPKGREPAWAILKKSAVNIVNL